MSAATVESPAAVVAPEASNARFIAVVQILAHRNYLGMIRIPATVIPTIVMPVFFVLAFSGSFSGLVKLPGFPTDNILNWMVPFAILQGASFAGLGAAFATGKDLENGFFDRLLLSPAPRLTLAIGPLSYSAARAFLPLMIVLPTGYLGGARIHGGIAGLLVLILGAVGTALVAGVWGLGVIYRTKTQSSGSLVQVGIFVTIFLSVGQVPLEAMTGWLKVVATLNPFTAVLTMARQGFIGEVTWAQTWPGLVALLISGGLLSLFAYRGFKKLIP